MEMGDKIIDRNTVRVLKRGDEVPLMRLKKDLHAKNKISKY